MNSKLLLELSANPEFGPYLKEIMSHRPFIPVWTAEKSPDDWVFYSGLQAGFDIFAAFFVEGDSQ